jgi:hypothetical protein
MARVWTTPVSDEAIERHAQTIIEYALSVEPESIQLPWIDSDAETTAFIRYWFGAKQEADLRRIAFALDQACVGQVAGDIAPIDVLRLALSRIIVTKEQGASLARDTSHSRPHKVADSSNFEVFPAFEKAIRLLRKRMADYPAEPGARISLGDARKLVTVDNSSIDAVLTSPPYLNAIDYLRGHRMSLVWLGRGFGELRRIRSNSIGAERAPNDTSCSAMFQQIKDAMGSFDALPKRYGAMIDRYTEDVYRMVSEVARVLAPGGTATFVVGNSCLKGTFVENASGVAEAARMMGLKPLDTVERALPENKRYLPITTAGNLSKRMRTETICSFAR